MLLTGESGTFNSNLTKLENFKTLCENLKGCILKFGENPAFKTIQQENQEIKIYQEEQIYDILLDSKVTSERNSYFKPLLPENFAYWLEVIEELLVDTFSKEDQPEISQMEQFYNFIKNLINAHNQDGQKLGKNKKLNKYYTVRIEEKIPELMAKKLKESQIN